MKAISAYYVGVMEGRLETLRIDLQTMDICGASSDDFTNAINDVEHLQRMLGRIWRAEQEDYQQITLEEVEDGIREDCTV